MQDIKSTYKNQLHFYTQSEKETVSFTIVLKRVKILRSKLNQTAESLYAENYMTLMKEIKDDTNRWRDIPCFWIGRVNSVKMTILPKAIYRFSAIPINASETPQVFLCLKLS